MRFNYPNTCPDIDKIINRFQDCIERDLIELIETLAPDLSDAEKQGYVDHYTYSVYGYAEEAFENVRQCNSDMRKHIEHEVDKFNDDYSDLEAQIRTLEYDLNNEVDKNNDLLYQIDDLKEKIDEYDVN